MAKLLFNKNEADNKVAYKEALNQNEILKNINKDLEKKNKINKIIIGILVLGIAIKEIIVFYA